MSEFNIDLSVNTAFYMNISHYTLMTITIMLNNKQQKLPECDKNHVRSGHSVKITKCSITLSVIFYSLYTVSNNDKTCCKTIQY